MGRASWAVIKLAEPAWGAGNPCFRSIFRLIIEIIPMNLFILVLVACLWSGSFIAIQPLVRIVPPVTAGALRIAVALAFLSVALPCLKVPFAVPAAARRRVWLTGFFAFGLPFAFLFWGEKTVSPGLAGMLNGTVPLWVFILGSIFTPGAEPATARKVGGLSLGFLGISLIFLPKVLRATEGFSPWGAAALAGMAMSYAVGVLLNRSTFREHPGLHPFANLFQQLVSALLTLLAISLPIEGLPRPGEWRPWSTVIGAELYLGCVSTSIAFMFFYRLIRAWGAVRASTVTYVVPSMTLILDALLNGALPGPFDVAGVIAVTLGVAIMNLPASSLRRNRMPPAARD